MKNKIELVSTSNGKSESYDGGSNEQYRRPKSPLGTAIYHYFDILQQFHYYSDNDKIIKTILCLDMGWLHVNSSKTLDRNVY